DVLAGRGEGDLRAGVREGRAPAGDRGRADGEADPALAVRARRLERRGGVLDRVALVVLVAGCGDQQYVVARGVLDGPLLERGRALAADREGDELLALVDRVEYRPR